MERGDQDLATLLKSGIKHKTIDRELVKFYWSEMLHAVQVIHKEGM